MRHIEECRKIAGYIPFLFAENKMLADVFMRKVHVRNEQLCSACFSAADNYAHSKAIL